MQVVKKTVYQLYVTYQEFLNGLNAYAKRIGSDIVLTEYFYNQTKHWRSWGKGFELSDYQLSTEWLPEDQEFTPDTYKSSLKDEYEFLIVLASALPVWNIPNLKEITECEPPDEVILIISTKEDEE